MLKRLGVLVAFALLGACSTTTPEAPAGAPDVRLYTIDCGTAVFPDVGMLLTIIPWITSRARWPCRAI